MGRGVFYGSALTEASACQDQEVYVVGGANSAGQAALYLAREAKQVTLVVRGDSLARSMSSYLVEQVEAHPRVRVLTRTEVVAASGDDHLEHLELRDLAAGATSRVECGWA